VTAAGCSRERGTLCSAILCDFDTIFAAAQDSEAAGHERDVVLLSA